MMPLSLLIAIIVNSLGLSLNHKYAFASLCYTVLFFVYSVYKLCFIKRHLSKIKNKELISTAIKNRYSELLKNKFSNNKFIIFPANSLESLQNESAQQNNCVRTYAEKYANRKCDIYFMRNISNPDKSLVTVEVINNKVVQSRIKNNLSPNKCQLDFLDNWEHNTLASV